jgi:hypothetical protein
MITLAIFFWGISLDQISDPNQSMLKTSELNQIILNIFDEENSKFNDDLTFLINVLKIINQALVSSF